LYCACQAKSPIELVPAIQVRAVTCMSLATGPAFARLRGPILSCRAMLVRSTLTLSPLLLRLRRRGRACQGLQIDRASERARTWESRRVGEWEIERVRVRAKKRCGRERKREKRERERARERERERESERAREKERCVRALTCTSLHTWGTRTKTQTHARTCAHATFSAKRRRNFVLVKLQHDQKAADALQI
jgi:hypothetical protein